MVNLDIPSNPDWWQEAQDVGTVINQSRAHKRYRERWKYTKPERIAAALVLDGTSWSDAALAPSTPLELNRQAYTTVLETPELLLVLCREPMQRLVVPEGTTQTLRVEHTESKRPTLIQVNANAVLNLEECMTGVNDLRSTLWLQLAPRSRVVHSRNLFGSQTQWHYLHVVADQDANYSLHNHSAGSLTSRQDIFLDCVAPGAAVTISGSACVAERQHLDQSTCIRHMAPATHSEQGLHNIALDQAKLTFNGRIHILANCEGSAAHLSNKNLARGNASINTKPELEIYTDDVRCSHGATIGRLDENQLFYCASRGIEPTTALAMLSRAFLASHTQGPLAEAAFDAYLEMLR